MGVRMSPLGAAATIGLLYQPQIIDDDDDDDDDDDSKATPPRWEAGD
jgi:hypothetical protein